MKSGKHKFIITVDLKNYSDYHLSLDCDGKFVLGFAMNGFYDGTALGPIRVPFLLMVECPKCGATFFVPEFVEKLDAILAERLITSKGTFNKKQIKFLRQYFNYTQEDLAKMLCTDKYEIAKMESSKTPRFMSIEKQIILKMRFAEILKIRESKTIYELSRLCEEEIRIKKEWFLEKKDVEYKTVNG